MQDPRAYAFTRAEALDYLQGQVRELRDIASAGNLDVIAYLLEMTYLEVSDTVRKERPHASADAPPIGHGRG